MQLAEVGFEQMGLQGSFQCSHAANGSSLMLGSSLWEDMTQVDVIHLVFTCMPGDS